MNIKEIKITRRRRKDLGDIDALAASMGSVGLLHPVVIDLHNNLICGERRLAAAKKLQWENIPVTVAEDIGDVYAASLWRAWADDLLNFLQRRAEKLERDGRLPK